MRIKFLIIAGGVSAIAITTMLTVISPKSPGMLMIASSDAYVSNKTTIGDLFATPTSLGALAIGAAEGNYTRDGSKTSIYYGHHDPADRVVNRGFCSDRGRGLAYLRIHSPKKKLTKELIDEAADSQCLAYIRIDLNKITANMKNAGLDPVKNLEVTLNAADLRNQANPKVHQRFVSRYVEALKRRDVTDKISWARTMAFYVNGRWTSSGLIKICDRENRGLSAFDCTYHDQNRRQQEIYYVLNRWNK